MNSVQFKTSLGGLFHSLFNIKHEDAIWDKNLMIYEKLFEIQYISTSKFMV